MPRTPSTLALVDPPLVHRVANPAVELGLAEALEDAPTRASRVTTVIAAALERIGDLPASVEVARTLSIGTRERLLQKIAARRRPRQEWREAACESCGVPYDFATDLLALPMKPAGDGFPVVAVDTSLGRRCFESPNGAHEETLAARGLAGEPARRALVAMTGLDDDADDAALRFAPADIDRIDDALEALSPDATDMLEGTCPSCGTRTRSRIDSLTGIVPRVQDALAEVHRLATAYGWSEAEILALPSTRRRRYLALIARQPHERRLP